MTSPLHGSVERPSPTAELRPMFTERQLRRLKGAVIVMGVVLILGFGLVIGRIVFLFNRSGPGMPTSAAGAAARPDLALPLPTGAVVRQMALAGDRLAIHFEAPEGAGIVIVELATGAIVQRVKLVPDGRQP